MSYAHDEYPWTMPSHVLAKKIRHVVLSTVGNWPHQPPRFAVHPRSRIHVPEVYPTPGQHVGMVRALHGGRGGDRCQGWRWKVYDHGGFLQTTAHQTRMVRNEVSENTSQR